MFFEAKSSDGFKFIRHEVTLVFRLCEKQYWTSEGELSYRFLMKLDLNPDRVLPNVANSNTISLMKTMSLKLSAELEKAIRDAAKRHHLPVSEWIRGAMQDRLKKEPRKKRLTAADTFGKYAGIIKSGTHDLSTNPKYLEGLGR